MHNLFVLEKFDTCGSKTRQERGGIPIGDRLRRYGNYGGTDRTRRIRRYVGRPQLGGIAKFWRCRVPRNSERYVKLSGATMIMTLGIYSLF